MLSFIGAASPSYIEDRESQLCRACSSSQVPLEVRILPVHVVGDTVPSVLCSKIKSSA